jgi:hypothetical protein
METVLVAIGTGFCSFVGSYAALKVHITYLRRDVDKAIGLGESAHKRINGILIRN